MQVCILPNNSSHQLTFNSVWPLADDTLTYDLLELLHAAKQYGLLKKGTNHGKWTLFVSHESHITYHIDF